VYVLELPHKSESPDALAYWINEVRKLKAHLEERFRCSISDVKLRSAITLMNRERRLRRQLAELMASEFPPLTGRQLPEFKSIISGSNTDLLQYERACQILGAGGATPGSPRAAKNRVRPVRVLMTGVPMVHGGERVIELVESCGAVVVCMENCTGLKPLLEDVVLDENGPLEAIARKY
jgi:benzoyl-CoA reductase/2-hydroxyglutaryl-CoA dehydratase subunit BcrC/BadD/HgdB